MAPLIITNSGALRGTIDKNIAGGTYVAFRGIPYAMPPIGDLRFRDPVPIGGWTGIRDATKFGEICCQYNREQQRFIGSEDCLYLNVYAPSLEPSKSRAVMVWIHGGRFEFGSGNDDVHGPDYFMKKDVIVVTLNYRLGFLGFFTLGDRAAPGNHGLKDQILALEWVKQNISKFGGDPNNITAFGHSAGASCIHHLTLSPKTRGLFQRVILQSGVAPSIVTPKDAVGLGKRFANMLAIGLSDPTDIVEYLRTVEVETLLEAQERLRTPDEFTRCETTFSPACDAPSDDPICPKNHQEAVKSGILVPCIIGLVSEETLMLQEHYIRDCGNEEKLIPLLVKLTTDACFTAMAHWVLEYQKASNAPTYFYNLSYEIKQTLAKLNPKVTLPGTSHADDLSFLFHHKLMDEFGKKPLCSNDTHNRIVQRIVEMWTNFAKTGNPTPKTSELIPIIWEPIDNARKDEYKCLYITDTLEMKTEENYFTVLAREMEMSQ
ncbi:esterase FE4 isoform X2 [Diachasma alloeum]|uniref:esterase FE4 isoform X2 n=1 Tax=Diachasma alloeum TaxID=454923 RepID=UPI0007384998|nr:esterase FE4 isoform X2 [Diachasma alloeum]